MEMREEVIIAGFGGQGILFAGKLLTWAGLKEGKEVTCISSYGAEMRGGTANTHIIISSREISSPVVENPTLLIVLNEPSLEKFSPRVRKGGIVVFNSSLIDNPLSLPGLTYYSIPASEMAEKLGNSLLTNMVILGATVGYHPLVSMENLENSLPHLLREGKEKFLEPNRRALREGYEFARKNRKT